MWSIDFDFSLLELWTKIEFNANVQPIALPEEQDRVTDNTMCLVTGWGTTDSFDAPKKLRGVDVPIVNQEECVKKYSNFKRVTPRMLCAGFDKGEKDACTGDSGIF